MNESDFVAKREPDWKRLTTLSAKAEASPTQLTALELREMYRLYKRVSRDLSMVRTRSTNLQLIRFLNDVVAGAYCALYRPKRKGLGTGIMDAIRLVAQTARKQKGALLFSAALFFGSAVFANVAMRLFPATQPHFVPAAWRQTFDHWREGSMTESSLDQSTNMTGFYMSNNPRASIIAGSIAASTFGLGTAKLLYENGSMLGALAFELEPVGRVGYLLIHIFPHGVTELSGIIVAGGAGFVMAMALLRPGRRTRGQALLDNGRDAIVLLCASVVMMFMAAPIEGFFSFNPAVPDFLRAIVILVSAIGWFAFWTGFGLSPEEKDARLASKAMSQ